MKKTIFFLFGFLVLMQSAFSTTINCTAGGLATALGSEVATVTNLTLTGEIDARDVKCMRNQMTALRVLDLSAVTINSFTGIGGTDFAETISTNYPTNELPTCSFMGAGDLTNVILPSSITSIGGQAFHSCIGLTNVVIPSSVTTLGDEAFINCGTLTSFTIPNSVTSVGYGAFAFCDELLSVTVGTGLTAVGPSFFEDCFKLAAIYASAVVPADLSASQDAFLHINKTTCKLYVPAASIAAYGAANQWSDFTSISALKELALTSNAASVNETGEGGSIAINSNTPWTAASDQGWLVLGATSGGNLAPAFRNLVGGKMLASSAINTESLTFTAAANAGSARSATITITPTAAPPQIFTVTQAAGVVTVSKTEVKNTISIFPNPTTEFISVNGLDGLANLKLLDLNGKILFSKQVCNSELVSLQSLPKGNYIVKIQSANTKMQQNIIKQ